MNEALAQWEASNGYGKVATIEDAMQILANAGYNSDNWVCLTEGYQVYWYETDNRCILYNSKTAEVEYPEEYTSTLMLTEGSKLHIYNENHVKAQQFSMSLSSETAKSNTTSFSESVSQTVTGTGLNSNQASNFTQLNSIMGSNAGVKASLSNGTNSQLYVYASREIVSADTGNAFCSLQVSAVGTDQNPVILESTGNLKENFYYLTIVNNGGTAQEVAEAERSAGQYLYNIFDQITTGKISNDATIVIAGGTRIDCSTCEWAPCKTFTGYFGTSDANNPIIIDGASLTSKTGYAQTVYFDGTAEFKDQYGNNVGHSKYFVTGFFGSIYGTTTIENIVFKNINMDQPANDYEINNSSQTRNTIGIIGGILNGGDLHAAEDIEAKITLKNIKVENSTITGAGGVGGLVGYVGDYRKGDIHGTIDIVNCHINADLSSTDTKGSKSILGSSYSPVGGIIGLANDDSDVTINITNSSYTGTASGYDEVAGCVGDNISGAICVSITNCDFSQAVLSSGTGTVAGLCSTNASSHGHLTVDANTSWNSSYYPLCYAQSNTGIKIDGVEHNGNTDVICRFLDITKTVKAIRLIVNGVGTDIEVDVVSGGYATKN